MDCTTTYFSVVYNAWGTAIDRAIHMQDDKLIDTLYNTMDYYNETGDLSKTVKAIDATNKKYFALPIDKRKGEQYENSKGFS